MPALKIGQVAKRAGVGVETIRFYERRGLIEDPPRKESGYRQYPEITVSRIRFIRRASDLGFSLQEVGELLDLRADTGASAGDVRRRTEAKILEIDSRITDLKRMKLALARLSSCCGGKGSISECPILEALEMDGEF